MLEDPDTILAELRRRQGPPEALTEEIAKFERMARSLEDQKTRVVKLYRFGEITDDDVERELKQIARLSAETETTIAQLKSRMAMAQDFEPIADRVKLYCQRVAANLYCFDFADKREVLSALQARITVGPEKTVSLFCVLPAAQEEPERFMFGRHASA